MANAKKEAEKFSDAPTFHTALTFAREYAAMGYANDQPRIGDIFRHAAELLRPRRIVDARAFIETVALATREFDMPEQMRMSVQDLAHGAMREAANAQKEPWPRSKTQALRLLTNIARRCEAARSGSGIVVDMRV